MNIRPLFIMLLVLVLALAACTGDGSGATSDTGAAPADTSTPVTEATATTTADSTTVTSTETMTDSEVMTETESITGTEEMTDSAGMTETEAITGTEEMTDSAGMTETEAITGTEEVTATGDAAVATEVYQVELNPADFVDVVDNPYFPLIPGTNYVYELQTADGVERTEVEVLAETKEILGITATVVRDMVSMGDKMIEDTYDWFAQDKEGNVWYLGEDVTNYENGAVKDKAGSWEAGVDGAIAGIVMFGDPTAHVGETYRQEYYAGEAEDMAELLSVTESVTVPSGSFDNVVKTHDFSPLDPELQEEKYYAQGIGAVKVVDLTTGVEEVLVEFTAP